MQLSVQTNANYLSAEKVLASKGKSFYWARWLLSKKYSSRATRLYRLCRYIDDLGDEEQSVEVSKASLEEVKRSITCGFSNNAILADGIILINECSIEKSIIVDLISGVQSDTSIVRINSEDKLIRYCYQVAGTVGLMMSKALDTHDKQAYPFAIDLGIAMQLTNICRDVKADALMNRRYIPSILGHDLEPIALIKPLAKDVYLIKKMLKNLFDTSELYYKSGETGLSYLPLQARLSILVAARIYREIGRKLKKRDYEYWHERIFVSRLTKLFITLGCLVSVMYTIHFWRCPKGHIRSLHAALNNQSSEPLASAHVYAN